MHARLRTWLPATQEPSPPTTRLRRLDGLTSATAASSGCVGPSKGSSKNAAALEPETSRSHSLPRSSAGLQAHGLSLSVDGRRLLSDVSFSAEPGSVTAIIGPSGAGKSTLIRVLGGVVRPDSGDVRFDGHDVHEQYATLRTRIGLVPQDDVVHRPLTLNQALNYAAALRLPAGTTAAERAEKVEHALGELELEPHRDTRIDKLSGGQRKRASVAMELITSPFVLILDEPTSGLDPALDRQVMTMLRQLADAGRVVVVVTHSLAYLHLCDQVLMLGVGGLPIYVGSPHALSSAMGSSDWADIFGQACRNPVAAHRSYLLRRVGQAPPSTALCGVVPSVITPPGSHRSRQAWTVAQRQVRLIIADRCYFTFLVVMPFLLACLSLIVPGDSGFGAVDPRGETPNEPAQILTLLNIAAVFMGTAITIRDLVGEKAIFDRERAVGLSVSAYVAAKVAVYSAVAALQTLVLTAIVVTGKGGPAHGPLVLGNSVVELYVTLAAAAVVSAILGLVLSSLARSCEQILPMLVVTIMVSIVFAGGLIPVTGRTVLEELSWLLPARWGFAASAATSDLRAVAPLVPADEQLWSHTPQMWLFTMAMLLAWGLLGALFVRWQLRLRPLHRPRVGRHRHKFVAAAKDVALHEISMSHRAMSCTNQRRSPQPIALGAD